MPRRITESQLTVIRLWLIGSGISASPSPPMQMAALVGAGLRGTYELKDVPGDQLPGLMTELRNGPVRGANVTMPYKVVLAAGCDDLEGDAVILGAVNTITREQTSLIGDNTDARGFELALRTDGLWPAQGCNAVVLGAGGAASAVVLALSRVPVGSVTVIARRPQAGSALAERLSGVVPVDVVAWARPDAIPVAAAADIIVNATPAGLNRMPFDLEHLRPRCAVIDIRYRPRPVDTVVAAVAEGRPSCDGLEMLLQQGMLSFTRWTGKPPPWRDARAALRAAVGG